MQTDEILRISPYRDGFITCSKEGIYGTKRHAFPKRRKKLFTAGKIIYSRTVKNRFTQFILYLHGFTEKRLPILAGSRKQSPKGALWGFISWKPDFISRNQKILLIALAG